MKLYKSIIAFVCLVCMACLCSCDIILTIKMENSSQLTASDTENASSDLASLDTSSINQQQNRYPDAISPDEYFGWLLLVKKGSEAEKKAYKQLVSDIGSYKSTINFDFKLTKSEFEKAYELYKQDYPEHFWRGKEYSLSSSGGKVKKVTLNDVLYGGDANKIKATQNKVNVAVYNIMSKINGSMSDFEKEILVHNYIIESTRYADGENSHSIVGVFVDSNAVCQGYSLAFQYVMRLAGVQCITVTGEFNGQSHMWNMIKLDGEFYHIDVTSDDPIVDTGEDVIVFNYFNLNDTQIKTDHTIKNKEFAVPAAAANKYEFFTKTGQLYEGFSVDSFANSIAYAYNNGYKYAYMRFEKADISKVTEYIKDNYNKIIGKANELLGGQKIKPDSKISVMYSNERKILNLRINY